MTIKNVLIIVADDLNDMIEPLGGHPQAVTPNLTRLAAMGLNCLNAAIAAWACSPSRIALLYGLAGWRTGAFNNQAMIEDIFPLNQCLSWVGRLRDAGWSTYQCGKVGHTNDPEDWTLMFDPKAEKYDVSFSQAVRDELLSRSFDFGAVPEGQGELTDEETTRELCETIHRGAEKHLWALGLHRPHFPCVVPQPFIDMIPDPVSIPPGVTLDANGEFNPQDDAAINAQLAPAVIQRIVNANRKVPASFKSTGEYLEYVRHYLAAVAYMDSLVGQVLDRLEACGLLESTLIIFTSDNGEQLGEKQCGRKFTLWDRVVRVPLIIAGPGIAPRNVVDPVSLLDIYATMVDLFGITPHAPLDGESLVPLFGGGSMTRPATVTVGAVKNTSDKTCAKARTASHSIIRYWPGSAGAGQCALEVYDHVADPYEHSNLAAISPRPLETQALIDSLLPLLPATMARAITGDEDEE